MYGTIVTVEDFTRRFDLIVDTFKIDRYHHIHLVETPIPGVPFELVGAYGYKSVDKPIYTERHFLISQADRLISTKPKSQELKILLRLAQSVEKRYKEQHVQVFDVRLPKSHGFSGNKYGHRQVKGMFPNLR